MRHVSQTIAVQLNGIEPIACAKFFISIVSLLHSDFGVGGFLSVAANEALSFDSQ